MMLRLSGANGLASAVSAAITCSAAERARTLLVFDWDRTLSNGMSMPGEANLAKLVRGGADTVTALRRAHEAGVGLYIVTARRPVQMTVRQLFASLDHAQAALAPFFARGEPANFQFNGIPLARGGCVYAADYQKAAALAHIVLERKQEGLRVFFFDDKVINSYVVATSTAKHLPAGELAPLVAELTAYWWDSFEEETGPSPTMKLSSFGNTEDNYADFVRHMLAAYGVNAAECDARIAVYRSKAGGPGSRLPSRAVGGAERGEARGGVRVRVERALRADQLGVHDAVRGGHGGRRRAAA